MIIYTETGFYVDSMIPYVSPRSEIAFEDFSKAFIVSKGGKSSSSQSSGNNEQSQIQPTSPRGGTT